MAKLTPSERQACHEMSELFLDTEITEDDIDRIAKELCDLPWPTETRIEEFEKLFWEDLFMTRIWNLAQLAQSGEWGFFYEDEVCDDIEHYRRQRSSFGWFMKAVLLRLNWLLWGNRVYSLWHQLKARLVLIQESRNAA
ncbi:hypothetical protein BDW02DRAFT_597119 [Decorospora gaudefroyi]|uniref:DUF7079 domain-containing protein n=1 Tax=Decorospora gaudefroyi TaxID=184978 RepID=A0A6A5KI91_9PLEO|nr:hypothetical protein BDW02DRAFT_597119 [Decorospora gaudefroyi]